MMSCMLCGCAYRLGVPPAQLPDYRLRITGKQGNYAIQVNERETRPGVNGVTTFRVPMHRSCRAYLFDRIPLTPAAQQTRRRTITVLANGKVVRRMSLRDLWRLPRDSDGTYLLALR